MSEAKDVVIGADAKKQLKNGVDILANAVKVTLGPRGRHVAIQRAYGAPLITKDGVTVARSIFLKNTIENMGAQLIKSVASAANTSAGDGTTTATVLAQAILEKGYAAVSAGHNPVLIKKGMDLAVEHMVNELAKNSTIISDEESIKNIAAISANNDNELGSIIAEAVTAVGQYGFINVEEGAGKKTQVVYMDGIKVDRGVLSTDFISNPKTLTCDMEDAYILCYDDKIEAIQDMAALLTEVANAAKPLLIIAKDFSKDFLSHILFNRIKNGLDFCLIKAPGFGDTRREMLKDLAIMVGATLLHNDHGAKFNGVTLSDLGSASKVYVGMNETTIIDGRGKQESISERISTLESQLLLTSIHDYQHEAIRGRLARITGSAAIFKVGGASESEVKEKKDRVEDAINAVKSALVEGVVAGGGAALIHASKCLKDIDKENLLPEEIIGIKIIAEAIKAPLFQILLNAGDEDSYYEIKMWIESRGSLSGYDALKRVKVEDMLKHGVIDPTKVVRTGLQQASSAIGTLLTTEATISLSDDITDY